MALDTFWRRLRRDRVALAALCFIAAIALLALLAPLWVKLVGAPQPNVQSKAPLDAFGQPTGPSTDHIFGVDGLGRDVFARVVYGARVSLEVALVATFFSVVLGVAAGLVAGYRGGWLDTVLSRGMDLLLAFPVLLLALGLASACTVGESCVGGLIEPGLGTVLVVIVIVNWPFMARIIRGQVLSLREEEYVQAARATGASDARVMVREILPNLVAPIVVFASLAIPTNILFEAALSFLGVGVQDPNASWGAMIADAISIFDTAWWYMLFPGLALVLTVLAFNLVGDGVQDALDPRTSS